MLKWLKRIGKYAAAAVVLLGVYLGYLHLTGNVHEVIAGEFYRTGQLSAEKFASVTNKYGIKTVINLRGASNKQWYTDEVAEAGKLGIKYIDFPMSARRELTLKQTETLVSLMRDAPKPLLVHCQGGADRSGLASLLYLNRIAGVNEDLAELQLSPLYGHVGIPYITATWSMDQTWEEVEKAHDIEPSGYL